MDLTAVTFPDTQPSSITTLENVMVKALYLTTQVQRRFSSVWEHFLWTRLGQSSAFAQDM